MWHPYTGPKAKRAVVHIGAPKTASTTIQASLALGRTTLAQRRVLYPRSLGETSHRKLAAALGPIWRRDALRRAQGVNGPRGVLRLRREIGGAFGREVAEARPELIVISCEHFFAQTTTVAETKRLARFLNVYADTVEVIVYLRRQDKAIFSAWLHALRIGKSREFSPPTRRPANDRHDYAARLRLWARAFRREAIIVAPFERGRLIGGDPMTDFCARARIDGDGLAHGRTTNASLDQVRAEFIRRFNEVATLTQENGGPARGDLDNAIDHCATLGSRRTLSPYDARAILALYRRSNEALARDWNGGEPFFSDVVDEPEVADSLLDVDDVISIAADLWAYKQRREDHLRRKLSKLKARAA